MEIVTSWMERGIEQGRQEGRQEGESRLLLRMLAGTLGALPSDLQKQIRALTEKQIEALGDRFLSLTTLDDLSTALNQLKATEETPAEPEA